MPAVPARLLSCPRSRAHCPPSPPSPSTPQTQRDAIQDKRCREEVQRQLKHEAEDLRFDHALAAACQK